MGDFLLHRLIEYAAVLTTSIRHAVRCGADRHHRDDMSPGASHTGQGPKLLPANSATRHESCLAAGKFYSYSLVSTYTLTATEYSETRLFSILNDQIGGKDIVYDLSGKTQSVPVNRDGGRLQCKPPFDRPSLVFEGNKMTATLEGGFVDVWEKAP
jgi:hypothetical protein